LSDDRSHERVRQDYWPILFWIGAIASALREAPRESRPPIVAFRSAKVSRGFRGAKGDTTVLAQFADGLDPRAEGGRGVSPFAPRKWRFRLRVSRRIRLWLLGSTTGVRCFRGAKGDTRIMPGEELTQEPRQRKVRQRKVDREFLSQPGRVAAPHPQHRYAVRNPAQPRLLVTPRGQQHLRCGPRIQLDPLQKVHRIAHHPRKQGPKNTHFDLVVESPQQ